MLVHIMADATTKAIRRQSKKQTRVLRNILNELEEINEKLDE